MRAVLIATLLALPSAMAQVNTTYVAGLVNALQALNLTSLIGAVTAVANSTAGQTLLAGLSSGQNFTLLAPTNDAFAGVNPFFSGDPTWLGQAIAYHVIPAKFNTSSILGAPDITVFPTLLEDPSLVKLLPNQSQNIGLQYVGPTLQVANQNNVPSIILNSTTYQNVNILTITTVLDLPPSLNSLLTLPFLTPSLASGQNITSLNIAVSVANLSSTLDSTPSITVFAPTDSAFAAAAIPPTANSSSIASILTNHVINGALVFTGGPQTNYTSLSGEQLTVGIGGVSDGTSKNVTLVYYRGEIVGHVVAGNIITQNGVVHLIDTVLATPTNT